MCRYKQGHIQKQIYHGSSTTETERDGRLTLDTFNCGTGGPRWLFLGCHRKLSKDMSNDHEEGLLLAQFKGCKRKLLLVMFTARDTRLSFDLLTRSKLDAQDEINLWQRLEAVVVSVKRLTICNFYILLSSTGHRCWSWRGYTNSILYARRRVMSGWKLSLYADAYITRLIKTGVDARQLFSCAWKNDVT